MLQSKGLRVGFAGLLLSVAGMAQAGVVFDIDGADGAYSPMITEGIDMFPGNALAVGSVPTEVGQSFTLHYQSEINSVTQNGGLNIETIPIGPNGPFEITLVVTLEETIQSVQDPDGDGFNETVSFSHSSGTFALYYDNKPDANDISGNSGTGYDNGELIAFGTVSPGSSNFTINEELDLVPLDSFGTDNIGVQTLDQGFGAAVVEATFNITNLNPNFFPNLDLATLSIRTTLETPFDNNNPSLSVNGVTPNYGLDNINGLQLASDGSREDFHFEVDGNASFVSGIPVPLPGTLALLGLGLVAIGFRRKA